MDIELIEEGLQDACRAISAEWGCDIYCSEHCAIFRAIYEIEKEKP